MMTISISSIAQMMAISITTVTQTSVTQMMAIVTISIRTGSVAKSVIVQPGVSLGISLSSGLGLGLSLLYGHDSLVSSGLLSSGGGHSRDQTVGKDSMSAGDGDTLVVLAAHGGRVDDGVVDGVRVVAVGEGKVVVHQRCPSVVGKP